MAKKDYASADQAVATKHAVEEALGVAEAVALSSTVTPQPVSNPLIGLDLTVSLREVIEQVEEQLRPIFHKDTKKPGKIAEDLDSLEIEVDVGRPDGRQSVSPKGLVSSVDAAFDVALMEDSLGGENDTGAYLVDEETTHEYQPPIKEAEMHSPASIGEDTYSGWENDPEMLRVCLEDKLAFYREGSYFEILELSWNVDPEEIEEAYAALRQQFDFDKYIGCGLAQYADRVYTIIEALDEAYEVLSHDVVREAYKRANDHGSD